MQCPTFAFPRLQTKKGSLKSATFEMRQVLHLLPPLPVVFVQADPSVRKRGKERDLAKLSF